MTASSAPYVLRVAPLSRDVSRGRGDDEVVHLREWGTGVVHPLPRGLGRAGAIIGVGSESWLRLKKSPSVTSQQARLVRVGNRWTLHVLGATASVRVDGIEHSVVSLAPGSEIEVGNITLMAESHRLMAQREIVARLVGWAPQRAGEIDHGLQAVRMAALRRAPLLLFGLNGDVVTGARLLHRHTLGPDRPFVICAPRRSFKRSTLDETVINDALKALKAATGGTLCIWQGAEANRLMRAMPQQPTWPAQIMVCSSQRPQAGLRAVISLPPLRRRAGEIDRIIDEYLVQACADMGGTFSPADRAWIRRYDGATHASIELAARRAAALRSPRSAVARGAITHAARVLGMAHSALSEWVARRKIPGLDSARVH